MYDVSNKFPSAHKAYFLDYYHPANQGSQNHFSKMLLSFKDGNPEGYTFFHKLINNVNNSILQCDIGLRALGSDETNSRENSDHPINKLLKSGSLNNKYVGHTLSKPITDQLKFAGNSGNRRAILSDTYL